MGPLVLCALLFLGQTLADIEKEAQDFITDLDRENEKLSAKSLMGIYEYEVDMSDENDHKKFEAILKKGEFLKKTWKNVTSFPWKTFKNETLKRMFQLYASLDIQALSTQDQDQLLRVVSDMQNTFTKATVCDYYNQTKCDLSLQPEITSLMSKSRNLFELENIWYQWYERAGKSSRDLFTEYVNLMNKAASLNNYPSGDYLQLSDFEDPKIKEKTRNLIEEILPLYKQLHAYVRYKLRNFYGEDFISEKGPIPEYLLGNMWAETWESIYDIVQPFPEIKPINITENLLGQGYTPERMVQISEDFFTSLNMSKMVPTFWEKSIFEKPQNRSMVCHASAWDLATTDDFRIKMCAAVNQLNFFTIHHEMGHIQYYMQYSGQPLIFRSGANSGFQEAVGDAIGLSVTSPNHLRKIGLYDGADGLDRKSRITHLLSIALKKLAFPPFGYLLDLWRWNVFSGSITPENYNCKYWELKMLYQGVAPPEPRSEEYFDPGAKHHISADIPYIRYLVSHILQFQFHKALCEKANEYDPDDPAKSLFLCDIHGSKEAGNAFKAMLELGCSKPWPDALELLTGTREMDAGPFLEYFKELHEWLIEENERNEEFVGWEIPQEFTCAGQKY